MSSDRKPKDVSRSIRLPGNLDGFLLEEARRRDLSVNALIVRILLKYQMWDVHAESRFTPVQKEYIEALLEAVDETKLIEHSQSVGLQLMRDNIIVWFKKVNRTTFLEWLRRYYTFAEPKAEIKTENNEAVITWENEKRSARFTTVQLALLRVAVESLLGVTPEIHASPTLILVKIPETQQRDSHSTN